MNAPPDEPDARALTASGRQFAVATPHWLATEAAARSAREGGTAVDAALAACAVLSVVCPHMCSIGGDLFALVATPGRAPLVVNGSGAAPLAIDPSAFRAASPATRSTGPLSVTVPGTLGGWATLARLGGRHGLDAALAPALALARDGARVVASLARTLDADERALSSDPGLRSVFFDGGHPLRFGQRFRQVALAATLDAIAKEGVSAFYRGHVGSRFVAGLRALGSPMALEDLERHETETTEPLSARYRRWRVLTAPPNSRGAILLETLRAIELSMERFDPASADAPLVAGIFALVTEDLERYLADPRMVPVPVARLPEDRVRALASLAAQRVGRSAGSAPQGPLFGDTVAVSAADAEGYRVVVIQSVFQPFGARILEPTTGIVCHDRGAAFAVDPGHPNVIAGGKRPMHTLTPVFVEDADRIALVSGSMGAALQPQVQAQLLGRILDLGEEPGSAVAAPRWALGGLKLESERDRVVLEAGLEALATVFAAAGMETATVTPGGLGHAQVVQITAEGELKAASDPRADGSAMAW